MADTSNQEKGGLNMKACEEIIDSISLYIDDILDKESLVEFNKHISECEECRMKLEEYKLQIELCNELEEDLPVEFKEQLHLKLVEEKEKERKREKVVSQRNRYMKMFATIAACIIFLVAAKGIFGNMNYHMSDSTNSAEAPKAAAPVADAPKAEAAEAEPPKYDVFKGEEKKAEAAQAAEQKMKNSAKSDNNGVSNKTADIKAADSYEADNNLENSQPKEMKGKIQADAGVKSFTATAPDVKTEDRNFSVTITVSNIDESIARIKDYLADSNGVMIEGTSVNTSMSLKSTDTTDGADKVTVFFMKIPNAQFEKFESSLKAGFDSSANIGTLNIEDISGKVSSLQNSLNEMNAKIDSGDISNQDELNNLKSERDRTKADLARIVDDSNYTYITISMKKK